MTPERVLLVTCKSKQHLTYLQVAFMTCTIIPIFIPDSSSPDVYLASASLITPSEWHIHTSMSSDHMPILMWLQTTATSSPARYITYINLKKANWTGYRQEIERKLISRHLPTDCQKDDNLFRATLLKAASRHIPTGRCKLYT